jgi:cytochrome P450
VLAGSPTVDLLSEELAQDPYPHYERWRDGARAWRSSDLDAWVISRFSDVRAGLANHRALRQSQRFEGALNDALGLVTMVSLDPPRHAEVRDFFRPHFRPGALEAMEPLLASAADRLLDGLQPGRPFVLSDVTKPLAGEAMALLVGSEEPDRLIDLSAAVLDYLRKTRVRAHSDDDRRSGCDAGRELIAYLASLRGRMPELEGPGLVRRLPPAEDRDAITLLGMCASVLVAGVETSVSGFDTTLRTLVEHPEAMDAIRADERLARTAFDEALRRTSPIQAFGRVAGEPIELGESRLEPGDEVLLFVGSANRDPASYDDPAAFSLSRSRRDHLAFGTGVHLCLGAPLVRLQAQVLLPRLLARFPRLGLDPASAEPRFGGAPLLRILDHVVLSPDG